VTIETKWTPGEWRADIRTGCYAVYTGPEQHCLDGADRDAIAFQAGRGERSAPDSFRYLTGEQIANAHLMAAAPDLYKALRELVERRERACRDVGGNPNGSDGRYARAHAALARARGETP
jgi:hypothetical protein